MKILSLILAFAFAAPIVASAQTAQSGNSQLIQKIENTYHTNFGSAGK